MLVATSRLAEPAWEWAERQRREQPEVPPAVTANRVRLDSLRISRVDGAVSGTPFLIALVPAYCAVLWQQVRMTLRIAAISGRDPRAPEVAAELLALRGVHATPDIAAASLRELESVDQRPLRSRRPLVTWVELGRRVLVVAGFIAGGDSRPPWWKRTLMWILAGAIWVFTWIFPVSFMALMSLSCEGSTRSLADMAIEFYKPPGGDQSPDALTHAPLTRRERAVARARGALMVLGILVPLGLIVAAVTIKQDLGRVIVLSLVATISGLALVVGLALVGRRY